MAPNRFPVVSYCTNGHEKTMLKRRTEFLCCVKPVSQAVFMYSGPDAWSWYWCTNAVNSCVLLFWRPLIYMILMAWHRHNFTQALAEYLNISSLILNKLKTQEEASDHNGLIKKHWKFLFLFFYSRPLSIETYSCVMLRLQVHMSLGCQQISCFSSAWMLLRGVHVWSTGTA